MTEIDTKEAHEQAASANASSTTGGAELPGYDASLSPSPLAAAPADPTPLPQVNVPQTQPKPDEDTENPFLHKDDDEGPPSQADGTPGLPSRPVESNGPQADAEVVPPELEGLKSMFPDFDIAIL